MPSVETRPYLSCAQEVVGFEPWIQERSGLPEILPPQLTDWDPVQDLALKRTLTIDLPRLRAECGLGRDAELALVVSWRSPGSGQRGRACERKLEGDEEIACTLEATVPGPELAGSVRLITRIVLRRNGSADDSLAARRPGSILWEDEVQLLLEGIGSRFPMEVISFSAAGLPARAAWRLHWNRDDLNAQAMGCFCLLLNKNHPRLAVAASRMAPDPEAKAIWSAINLGVAREIITGALAEPTFVEPDATFEDNSVGDVALTLIARAFPGATPAAVLDRQRTAPDRFECELQAAFNLFDPAP